MEKQLPIRLTDVHEQFWAARHRPLWSSHIKRSERRKAGPSVHECVNAHANISALAQDRGFAVHNLLGILRMARKRGQHEVRAHLLCMVIDPGTVIEPERRTAFARKWLRRMSRPRVGKG